MSSLQSCLLCLQILVPGRQEKKAEKKTKKTYIAHQKSYIRFRGKNTRTDLEKKEEGKRNKNDM